MRMRTLAASSILGFLYISTTLALFLYSYTQVDLSLTLSQNSIWQAIQKAFQYVGFYMRPASTAIFILLIFLFYALYAAALFLIRKGAVTARALRTIIISVAVISAFSYPAFSYDIFNYMFSAKTILIYGQNPYLVKPLDFTGVEPWLSFMRWTHLPSAYTPFWILISLIPYLLGFSTFLLILWNMKLMLGLWYLLSVYLIYKILILVRPKDAVYGTAIFALNPLVLIESVVSPHNDIVMAALALLSMYLFLVKKPLASYLALAGSVAAKLMTIMLYPVAFTGWNRKWALLAMTVAVIAGFIRKELLPWYLLWVMPFVALNPELRGVLILASGVSVGLLLRYAPVLYFGNYDDPVGYYRIVLFIVPLAVSLIAVAVLGVAGLGRGEKARKPGNSLW